MQYRKELLIAIYVHVYIRMHSYIICICLSYVIMMCIQLMAVYLFTLLCTNCSL